MNSVVYPQDIVDWQAWIIHTLGIDVVQAGTLIADNKFPFDKLIEAWKDRFGPENGYSPNFIPALVRNKIGFVTWVYMRGPEPNWTKSDNDQ